MNVRLLSALLLTSAIAAPAIASTVTGTVADSGGVRPLQGADVRIPSLGRVTSADSAGRFRFTGLPAGTYEVVASFAGAGSSTQSVTVGPEGSVAQLNFALAPEGTDIDTILVIGQQANMLSSIARQRAADTVVTVLTKDAMGQFPDQNVAESLRRAPGINVLNDQGEGRFVAVRGLDPNLNSTSINGARVPATGGDERAVALDVIPAELVESIEIKKSLTPDMDGDTIGASIEINTTSAFDREKGFVSASVEGGYNQLSEKWSPKIGVNFAQRLGENFGVSGGFSWNKRKFSTDNIEVADWTTSDSGIDYAETIEYRDYDVQRVRWGGNLSLDWRPADNTTLYLRGLYSKFDDTELRTRLVFKPSMEPSIGSDTGFSFESGAGSDNRMEIRRDIKDRREWQTTTSIVGGGRTEVDAWTLEYSGSWSRAEQKEDGSIDPMRFRQRFQGGASQLGVDFDFSDWQRPEFAVRGNGAAAFNDASKYVFSLLEQTTKEDAVDKEWAFKTDIARSFALAHGDFELKWGGKARLRHKRQAFQYDVYDGFDGDFYLSDVVGTPSYGLADIGPVPDLQATRDWVKANRSLFELNQLDTDLASNAETYDAKEDVLATYLQGRFQTDTLRLVGGLRLEHTNVNMTGNRVDLVAEGGTWNGEVLDEDTLFISSMQVRNNYTDWLPSLHLRADLSSDIVARAGVYRSISRPSFGKMAPRFSIDENDEGEREGEFGNPDLKPYRAWNGDATIEYYFAPKAVVQAGVFWKSISDFIVDAQFEDGTFQGISFTKATIPINGDRARVLGLEASYSQAFTMLPAPFDGLLVNLNYTYTDAKGDLADGRRIPLPNASKHTFNAVLGYDKGMFSARIAGAYRDTYLDELGSDAESDRYVRPHFQLDLSAKLRVTDNIQLFGDLVNINNAKYTAYQNGPTTRRLLQYEVYKMTAKVGVKASF